ncbi:MAG: hypothetical protein MMC23_003536 [Stictis urceolatum]|nr:hypothetical protein [Stictis urceolata]
MKRCSWTRQLVRSTQRQYYLPSPLVRPIVKRCSLPIQWPNLARSFATEVSAAELQFGQPLHETHPHLLGPGERTHTAHTITNLTDLDLVTPGISALEYAQRRSLLASKLPPNSLAILASSDTKYRSGSVFYEFHQEPNFFYLTGFNEPDSLAVIAPSPTPSSHEFHLFVRPKSPKDEIWEGARSGLDAATDVFNADETGDIAHLHKYLRPLLASATKVYTDIPSSASRTPSLLSRLLSPSTSTSSSTSASSSTDSTSALLASHPVKPLSPLLHSLRAFKSPAEISCMRHAGRASGRAYQAAMRRTWTYERDLADFLEYRFRRLGCSGSAYIPVVAAGRNANTIHYVRNDMGIKEGEWVLVDAGGEWGGYVADITRTFPAGRKFGGPQRELYEVVLGVQRSCVALCREDGGFSLDGLHEVAERGLREGLKGLGFETGGRNMEVLFPHHVGHYVGLDVHDCPGYSRRDKLRTGQCVTVEPGVYVPDDERWPKAYRGLGVRIEDSVCVQEESPLVLTTEAVKEVVDIEALKEEGLELEKAEKLR